MGDLGHMSLSFPSPTSAALDIADHFLLLLEPLSSTGSLSVVFRLFSSSLAAPLVFFAGAASPSQSSDCGVPQPWLLLLPLLSSPPREPVQSHGFNYHPEFMTSKRIPPSRNCNS